ncbi:hypothetical protein IWQ56_002270 [Coemansia nantahalensis]|nr:hypothetical protein IWQ56_002270 [Coemansia nantahalensis]
MSLAISTEFGYCVIVTVAMAIQCKATVMEVEVFRELNSIPDPESDGGQVADQLSDEDQAKFSRIKHLRDSYHEHLITALPLLILAGLFYPILSANTGNMYILVRAVYSQLYIHNRPEARKYCMPFIRGQPFIWAILAMHGAAMVTIFA